MHYLKCKPQIKLYRHIFKVYIHYLLYSFLARMGKLTGDEKYFNDAANQVLNYNRYLWCPEKQIYYHCYHTDNKEHGVAHWSRANGRSTEPVFALAAL